MAFPDSINDRHKRSYRESTAQDSEGNNQTKVAVDIETGLEQVLFFLEQIADEQNGDPELFDSQSVSVSALSTANHNFTATEDIRLVQVQFSASDIASVEILVAPDGVNFSSRGTYNLNSNNLDRTINFNKFIEIPEDGIIRVAKTNRRALGAQNINSVIVYNTGI